MRGLVETCGITGGKITYSTQTVGTGYIYQKAASRTTMPRYSREPTINLDISRDKTLIMNILPGTNYHVRRPIEILIERECDYYYVTSRKFYTIGSGANIRDALEDFGSHLLENYNTYKQIPKDRRSYDMNRMIEELSHVLQPKRLYAAQTTRV